MAAGGGPVIGDLTQLVDGETVDLVAVERALSRLWPRPPLSRADQVYAARLLLERGHGTAMVGNVLGVSGDTASALIEEANGR
jgi:hypothetical protein